FAATLAVQSVWSALVVVNLQTSPALPWSVVVMAIALWSSWEYAGGRWAPSATRDVRRRYRRARALPPDILARSLAAGILALGALASLAGSIVPGIVVHAIGLLIFFTLVWPADASRATVALGQADASFWLEVVACIALAAASAFVFAGLADATRARRSAAGA